MPKRSPCSADNPFFLAAGDHLGARVDAVHPEALPGEDLERFAAAAAEVEQASFAFQEGLVGRDAFGDLRFRAAEPLFEIEVLLLAEGLLERGGLRLARRRGFGGGDQGAQPVPQLPRFAAVAVELLVDAGKSASLCSITSWRPTVVRASIASSRSR